MKQRSSLTIGLIVGNICNSFFSTVVGAIESTVLPQDCFKKVAGMTFVSYVTHVRLAQDSAQGQIQWLPSFF
jgi:hypothetical protein